MREQQKPDVRRGSKLRRKPEHSHPAERHFSAARNPSCTPPASRILSFNFPCTDSFRSHAFRHRSEAFSSSPRVVLLLAFASFAMHFASRAAPRFAAFGLRVVRLPPALSWRSAGVASVARSRAVRPALVRPAFGACPGFARPGSSVFVRRRSAVVREPGLGLAWSRRRAAGKREARRCVENTFIQLAHIHPSHLSPGRGSEFRQDRQVTLKLLRRR